MNGLLASWCDRLRAWGKRLWQPQEKSGGTLWLQVAAATTSAAEAQAWALQLRAIANQARLDAEATLARLAERLPAATIALGEWRGDTRDVLLVATQWQNWPEIAGHDEINHWLWLAGGLVETDPNALLAARRPDAPDSGECSTD